MEVTRVRFYSNGNLRREKDELKYCSVTFDYILEIHDILLKQYDGSLVVLLPKRGATSNGTGERYYYRLIHCNSEVYFKIKQAVLEQWERYTSKKQEKPV